MASNSGDSGVETARAQSSWIRSLSLWLFTDKIARDFTDVLKIVDTVHSLGFPLFLPSTLLDRGRSLHCGFSGFTRATDRPPRESRHSGLYSMACGPFWRVAVRAVTSFRRWPSPSNCKKITE